MDKTTLSILAFCLGSGGVAHAQDMVDLKNLKVLEENRISVDDYNKITKPNIGQDLDSANYDAINSNLTAGNYDAINSNISAGNYDSITSNLSSGNYDSINSNIDDGNYGSIDGNQIDFAKKLSQMPGPQANN